MAEAADTIKAVSSEGRQMLHFANAGSNYQHPAVEEAIVTMVRDMCRLLAAYPAFRGVHFMSGGYFAPAVFKLHYQMDLLKNSYDDTSIRRFEDFAHLRVPDFGRDREKFRGGGPGSRSTRCRLGSRGARRRSPAWCDAAEPRPRKSAAT